VPEERSQELEDGSALSRDNGSTWLTTGRLFLLLQRRIGFGVLGGGEFGGGAGIEVGFDATGVTFHLETSEGEDARGEVTHFAHSAEGDDRFGFIDFVEVGAQGREGDVDGACGAGMGVHEGTGAHVDDLCVGGIGEGVDGFDEAVEFVGGGEACDVDEVLGASEGRSVGELKVAEVFHGHAGKYGGGEDIEAFVNAFKAGGLSAEEDAGVGVPEYFEGDGPRSGVVAGVVVVIDRGGLVGDAGGCESALGPTGESGGYFKHADNGGAEGTGIGSGLFSEEKVIGCDAALAVGGASERNRTGGVLYAVGGLNGIAGGVDIEVVSKLVLVDEDVTAGTEFDTSLLGQGGVGTHADGKDDELSIEGFAGVEFAANRAFGRREAGDAVAENEVYAVVAEFALHEEGHFTVELGKDLFLEFNDGDLESEVFKLLGGFQADETGTDDDGALGGFGSCLDPVHVLKVAQGVDAWIVDAFKGRTDGHGTGCEHELVVAEPLLGIVCEFADPDLLGGAVDFDGFGEGADIEVEHSLEGLRRLDGEGIALGNLTAYVVGKTAIGEGYVGSAFQDGDVGVLGEATRAGCERGTGGDATDDEDVL